MPKEEAIVLDLLVIGGGIHGAAVARDAALRGLRVALLEGRDFGSGTSSRTSKLVHGGIRYLETGQLGLVREALRERALLLELAASFVRPLPFLIPHYDGDPRGRTRIRVGLALYAALAREAPWKATRTIGPQEALALEPGLRRHGLRAASLYHDAQVDDALLCVATVLDAESAGAIVRNYAMVQGLARCRGHWRATVRGTLDDSEDTFEARVVVNATGPWVDEVRREALGEVGDSIRHTRGSHVVLPFALRDHALLLTARRDGRVFFAVPWGERTLVGTTDVDDDTALELDHAPAVDVRYLCEEASRALPGIVGLRPIRAFAGLRSLVRSRVARPWASSRESRIIEERDLVSIVGGKYTTHRSLAEGVVDRVARRIGNARDRCRTAERALGADRERTIESLAGAHPGRLALPGGLVLREAEVAHAVRAEKARRLEDVLLRRTRLWLDGGALRAAAPAAAEWMANLGAIRRSARATALREFLSMLDTNDHPIEEAMT